MSWEEKQRQIRQLREELEVAFVATRQALDAWTAVYVPQGNSRAARALEAKLRAAEAAQEQILQALYSAYGSL